MPGYIYKIPFIKGNKVRGVHLEITKSGEFRYTVVDVVKRKSKIEIENKKEGVGNFEDEISLFKDSKTPICLSIEGRGIIHKKNYAAPGKSNENIIENIIPNSNIDDFIIQEYDSETGIQYISIAKKEIITQLEKTIPKNNIYSLIIGGFNLSTISAINNTNNIDIPGQSISFENNKVVEIKRQNNTETDIRIGDELINTKFLPAYANALSFFIEDDSINEVPESSEYKKEILAGIAFKKVLFGALTLFFIVLLVNFFVFDHYNNKKNFLSGSVNNSEHLLNKLSVLKEELKFKKDFISKSGFLESSRNSFIADRIASTIPKKITLTKLEVNPVKKKFKKEEKPQFNKGVVIIGGISKSSTVFNLWIKELKKISWIKDISINEYEQKTDSNTGEFELKLSINLFNE